MIQRIDKRFLITPENTLTIADPDALYDKINEIIDHINKMEEKYPYEKSISSISGESRIMTREMIEGRLLQNDKESWNEDYDEEDLQTRFAFYTYKDEPDVLYLSNLFVEEASRNRGLGSKILKAAEKVAETIDASSIMLKAKLGTHAINLYSKNGLELITEQGGYGWFEKKLNTI